ncbi:hypothetical protein [Streptomyces luteogriseus]|uniref:hypothetical protein n=1 Tax=Streptomyces luteogriseus TaxID=68233 RepID=UPI003829AE09
MQPDYDLTNDQKKAFEENRADFAELKKQMLGFAEVARSRLAASGLHRGAETHPYHCFLCACTEFRGPPGDNCPCGHQMTSHEGYL